MTTQFVDFRDPASGTRWRLEAQGDGSIVIKRGYNHAGGGTNSLVVDSSGNVDVAEADGSAVGLKLGGTLVTADATELNKAADVSAKVAWFDDFLGDLLDDSYSVASGSDAQATDPAINAAAGGTVRLTTGDSNTSVAADASSLTHELNWQADNGNLVFEARVKVDAITNVQICVGLTDAKADGTLELPFTIGGSDAITSNASDAVCFTFDTGADTDEWFMTGVKGDTDSTDNAATGVAPTAGTYQVLRIEVDSAGDATLYIDGTQEGTLSGAVTAGTSLTPIAVVNSTTTSSRNLDVDYLDLSMDR